MIELKKVILDKGLDSEMTYLFHMWGLDVLEHEDSSSSYSVGIVENPRGEIIYVDPVRLTFVKE